jgi:hypothetical protein
MTVSRASAANPSRTPTVTVGIPPGALWWGLPRIALGWVFLWAFLDKLALLGLALMVGVFTRLAALGGIVWMALFYTSSALWPENNPVIDDHVIYAIALAGIAAVARDDSWDSVRGGSARVSPPAIRSCAEPRSSGGAAPATSGRSSCLPRAAARMRR